MAQSASPMAVCRVLVGGSTPSCFESLSESHGRVKRRTLLDFPRGLGIGLAPVALTLRVSAKISLSSFRGFDRLAGLAGPLSPIGSGTIGMEVV